MAKRQAAGCPPKIDGDFVVFLIGALPDKFHPVRAGEYEAIYGNMPPFGLGKAGRLVPVADAKTARDRFRAAASGAVGQSGRAESH
jgi:hypothetical protein